MTAAPHGTMARMTTSARHREERLAEDGEAVHRAVSRERRKANLLLLTSTLGVGGAETVLKDLVHNLDRDRFNVSVCCLKTLGITGTELASEGIDITVLHNSDPDRVDYLSALQLRRVLQDKQIDIVHSHTTEALVDAAVCRILSRSVKVVHTFHFGNYPYQPGRTLMMERISSRFVDRLVAVGHVQRAQIKETYRLSDRAIGAVHNGVRLPAAGGADPEFRRQIAADGKILVGTIAHLCPQKGLHDLLSVAKRVRDARPNVHFVVVGGGDLRSQLEQQRNDLGLDGTVTFTGVITEAASHALPSFDVYFQPSLWEAMSISLLEAMAAGKSIVSTNVGEAPHLIDHGADGFLYKPGDIDGMAAALLSLVDDARLREDTGNAAARKVAERFTVEHMTRAYETLYMRVLQWDQIEPATAPR